MATTVGGSLTLDNWNRTPESDTFMATTPLFVGPLTLGAGVANTTIQAGFAMPFLYKIRKVGVFYTACNSVASTLAFNFVVGTTGAYTQGVIAPNDNSYASGTALPTPNTNAAGVIVSVAGAGYPTNVAIAGEAVFSADIGFTAAAQQSGAATNSTYAPGWISVTTSGGYGIFVPPNYDAVYPVLLPLTLRAVTTASTGSITGLSFVLDIVPVTPTANPGSGSTGLAYCIPGVSF